MSTKQITKNQVDLMRYIINETPELKEAIDLPVQGTEVRPIGSLIVSNTRMRNAFINAINTIAITIIGKNEWNNPWEEFTEQGKIAMGQSVREMVVDLVEGHDYNENSTNELNFLKTEVPNIYNYMHEINFQKFYKVTVNIPEIQRAFTTENGLYNLIDKVYGILRESYIYDKYLIDKYQIQRRIIDGTVPSVTIPNFETSDERDIVAFMKEYSNNMTFRSPNYNPAGLLKATPFEAQRTMLSTGLEAKISTKVLATSYFKNEAELKTKLAMVDGFASNNYERLSKLLGKNYKAFTSEEKQKLDGVISVIIDDEFFKDYIYALNNEADTESTDFMNPETLNRTMWLHIWRIFSTSPFENCLVFSKDACKVTSVTVSPKTATVMEGQDLNLSSVVVTSGICNKAVVYSIDGPAKEAGVIIRQDGKLSIPDGVSVESVTVTATSVYDNSQTGTATITIQKKM